MIYSISNSARSLIVGLKRFAALSVLGLVFGPSQPVFSAPAPDNSFSNAFQSADSSGMIRVIVTLKDADTELGELRKSLDSKSAIRSGMRSAQRMSALEGKAKRRATIARFQNKALEKLQPFSFRTEREFNNLPMVSLRVSRAGLEQLLADSAVNVEVEKKFKPLLASSVPLILGVPPVGQVGGYDPAASSSRGAGWTVAIIDTGVEKANALLGAPRVVSEACYSTVGSIDNITTCPANATESILPGSGEPCDVDNYDECNHGTLVAVVAAGNGNGYDGVATGADLMSVKVFSYDASAPNTLVAYESDVLKGLDRVLEVAQDTNSSIKIASVLLAIGVSNPGVSCDTYKPAFKLAIDSLKAEGIATIAASGNSASSLIDFPACISTAISVGASDDADARWVDLNEGSNEGAGLSFYAPGVDITVADVGNTDIVVNGTSFAAAHVAGAWAVLKEADTGASVDQVKTKLTSTAVAVSGTSLGNAGRIQLNDALLPIGLTVIKSIDSPYGGSATVDDFNVSVDGVEVSWPLAQSTTGDSKLVTSVAGTYTLSEAVVEGYENGTWSCADDIGAPISVSNSGAFDGADVVVGAGEIIICEITNTQIDETIFFVIPLSQGGAAVFGL